MNKSYVENSYQNGIFTLPVQISPLTVQEFKDVFLHTEIIAYGFSGISAFWRTFQVASNFLLYFDNDKIVEFGSLLTMPDDSWHEYGSLSVTVHNNIEAITQNKDLNVEKFNIEPVKIASIHKLILQDKEMVIDCGIVFVSDANYEIEIAAGYSLSVTVRAPFSTGQFEPDVREELLQRTPI